MRSPPPHAGVHAIGRHLLHRLTTLAGFTAAAIVLQVLYTAPLQAKPSARPNIVLIMADDMGYECLSSNGGEPYKTPRIDALAKEGLRFRNCHSQPICTPTRVQIMSGIYNNRNYVQFGLLDPRITTFGNILKKAGYRTCIAGKWQLRNGLEGPKKFGFDEYCLWQVSRRPSRYANPGLEVNGELKDYKNGEYGPDVVSDYICDFMERNKDRRFFAYYPMILPHWPFEPPPWHADYDKNGTSKDKSREAKYFAPMVAHVDKIVGKIDDKLKSLGIRENTLLIFTGDNGTYVGITSRLNGKPYQGGKGHTRDNGTHVPLVVSWPGTAPKGRVLDTLIDFSDMLPTLADVAGAEVPADLRVDGLSFKPLLKGEAFEGRKSIYCWYERHGKRGRESQHIRTARYKLYADGRFFDVIEDFQERKPLKEASLSDEQRSLHADLKIDLDKHVAETKKATAELQKRFPQKSKQPRKKKNQK